MRLVREILVADAEPGVVDGDAPARARRFLQVVTEGLGLRAAGLFLRAMATGQLDCAASTLPGSVSRHMSDPAGRLGLLARRAVDERRAFVLRRTSEEPLVQELREADPAIETVAMVPLVDRTPVGILVVAGSEAALAPEIIRTLNPALRLLAILVSPTRDGARTDIVDPAELEAVRIERDAYARQIIELQGRITELESAVEQARATGTLAGMVEVVETPAETAARMPRPMPAPAGPAVGAPAAPTPVREDDPNAEQVLVVIDTTEGWERHQIAGHRIVVLAPAPDLAARVRELAPSRLIVNALAPGALAALMALRADDVLVRASGVLVEPDADRVVGLGPFDAVGHPMVIDALVAAVMRVAPRNARIFAAGRDAEALMKVRQALAKAGHSVSMARDVKQIDELVTMVKPQLIIADLELPMREGYELVMRAAAAVPPAGLVLIVPAGGDPSGIPLAEKLRARLAAGLGSTAAKWLAELTADSSSKAAKLEPKKLAGVR